jgi:hypothetical protein
MYTEMTPRSEHGRGWCIDVDTSDNPVARRNVLAGLWAGRVIGLEGAALTSYARSTHRRNCQNPGSHSLAAALISDLTSAGIMITEADVYAQVQRLYHEALDQVASTD